MKGAREMPQINIRMPNELKTWIQKRAERDERSMNWVVVKLIEKAKTEEEDKQ